MNAKDLRIVGKYSFTNTNVKLHYIGYNFSGNGYWHQFEKKRRARCMVRIATFRFTSFKTD